MQVCVNTILYHRCLPGYFVMNTDFLTMVAIHNNYYSWLNLQAEGQLNTLLADLSSYLTNTRQGLFTALKKPLEWPTCFLLFLHSEGKEPVQWVFQHRAGRRAFMVYWCFRMFTLPYCFSPTHMFFHFVIVIYTHSPPCPLRVLALRPPDASSSTLFLFLVSATIKNTIRVLSLTVGQWLILKLKILTLERYLLKIKYMFQAQKKLLWADTLVMQKRYT